MSAIGTWLLKFFVDYLWGKVSAWITAFFKEKEAREVDKAASDSAIADLEKAGKDPLMTPEQREKELEDAFTRFHDRVDP